MHSLYILHIHIFFRRDICTLSSQTKIIFTSEQYRVRDGFY